MKLISVILAQEIKDYYYFKKQVLYILELLSLKSS